ncbi:hypothetical protein ACFL5Z_12970 [Planctomycetota bacterium]
MSAVGTIARQIALFSLILLIFSGPQCFADLYSGSIHGDGGGIFATGSWDSTDTILSWDVVLDPSGDFYTYTYTFTVPNKALSHSIIQVSDTFGQWGGEAFVNDSLNPAGLDAFLDTYTGTGNQKPNPGMPGSIYGLKFENDADPLTDEYFGQGTTWIWSFNSLVEPVWGNSYFVDGVEQVDTNGDGGPGSKILVFGYNSGFTFDPYALDPATGKYNYELYAYIATPDTTVIPVPGAVLLGIIGLGAAGMKLRKFA